MFKKILITGGAGFIGSNYAHYCTEHHPQSELVVLDNLTYAGNLDNIQSLIDSGKVRFAQGDISDADFIAELFEKERFSAVVNFAAETHVDRSIVEPSIFLETNVAGTHNLLKSAREFGVERYHQVSTDEVYGDLGDDSTNYFTEETSIAPNCPYAASKASADLFVRSYNETYRMAVTISRCSNNYGPYQFPEKLIPFFFQLAEQGKELPLYGDGKNVRDWLYVEDHCSAIDTILHNGKAGEVYNIGGNNEKQNIEIAQLILSFLGRPTTLIRYVEDRKAHDRRYAIDASKMKRDFAWEPTVTFEEGIKKTFDWYKANQEWWMKVIEKHNIDESRKHIAEPRSAKAQAARLIDLSPSPAN